MPTVGTPAPSDRSGLIIFSMGDGQYKHLFAYHPSYLPVTRITADPWDFDFPAINPDGSKIAYCANQFGQWDIFILDLVLNQVERVTTTDSYDCAPSWSPDGQWLAFERYQDGKFDIIIHPVIEKTVSPIQLTDGSANNYSPTWSPDGRQIAFVTDRNGRSEIWLARLDDPLNRFISVVASSGADYSSPSWSPNGLALAWSKSGQDPTIEVRTLAEGGSKTISLGVGSNPVWMPDGSGLLVLLELPNQSNYIAYDAITARLLLPPIPLIGHVNAFDWKASDLAKNINTYLATVQVSEPASLWQQNISLPNPQTGRYGLVKIENISVPEPYLSDAVDESFVNLHRDLSAVLGWDYLATLENAAITLTSTPPAGIDENWFYTGRAIAVSQIPLEAGWMAVSREDYNGKTYWRVWLKCYKQDGSCGAPVRIQTWDFSARYSDNKTAHENGGKINGMLEGYWVDFTEFASRYGWQRVPSNSDWRSYFPGIQLNVFVLNKDLSWKDAMLQLYPPETVNSLLKDTP
jgi:TolB protein